MASQALPLSPDPSVFDEYDDDECDDDDQYDYEYGNDEYAVIWVKPKCI